MNRQLKPLALAASLLLAMLATSTVYAEVDTSKHGKYPTYYPGTFDNQGTVRDINLGKSEIIIDGTRYSYQSDLRVHTTDSNFASARNLRTDSPAGFSYTKLSDGSRRLSEIWLLR